MRPVPEFMSPETAVEVINSLEWPEDWPTITAEFVPAHPEWDEDEQANVTVRAVILVRAEAPCEWFAHGKLPVVHGMTVRSEGERDRDIDSARSLADSAWMALADDMVREHAKPRILGQIREDIEQAQHILDLFRASSEGGAR